MRDWRDVLGSVFEVSLDAAAVLAFIAMLAVWADLVSYR